MKYLQIPGAPDAVIWQDDEGNSGLINEGGIGWDVFLTWKAEGHKPLSMEPVDNRPVDELRANAVAAINAAADAALIPITSQYPRTEIDSWSEQCLEARAWLANASAHTPLLDAIAGHVDSTQMEALCLNILSKADGYKTAVGGVIAWRRAVTQWVETQANRDRLRGFVPQFPEVPHAS